MACCGQIGMGAATPPPAVTDGGVVVRHCDVCLILHGDQSPKEVRYCKLCDQFMCAPCRRNPVKRAAALFSLSVKRVLQGT